MLNFLINQAVDANMRWGNFKIRRPLMSAIRQTQKTQHKLLMKILRENAQTEFGIAHNFGSISSIEEYRKNVPIHKYDQLAPLINRQIDGELTLTSQPPLYYARTSGTTGRYKDIPLTRHGIQQVKHAQKHLAISLWQGTSFMSGSILGFASPAEEGRLKNGIPFGSMSGSTYKSVSPVLAKKFVLPPSVFSIDDINAKYQAYALAVTATENLTGIVAANPSSILKLAQLIESNLQNLLSSLAGESNAWLLPEALAILPDIRKRTSQRRITQLDQIINSTRQLNPRDIWPKLSTIATWTGGSCGIALHQLKRHLPDDIKFVEFGYGASEFMGSVNVDARNNVCLPLLNHHVYEFVRRTDWEAKTGQFVGLHQLHAGEEYYIFVTTRSGLYRYDINDIVLAEPGLGDCPALGFIQKGRGVTNITGEKLSESQLIEAVNQVLQTNQVEAGGFMALADEGNSRYCLYLEYDVPELAGLLAQKLDSALRALNSEYDDKRESGRLRQITVIRFRGNACETIRNWALADGVREAQYKPTILAYSKQWQPKLNDLIAQE